VDNPTEFKGKARSLRFDHEKKLHYLALTQEKFISSMQGGKVEKKKYDQQIDPSDMPEYRSVGGCLQWLSADVVLTLLQPPRSAQRVQRRPTRAWP
jgi:hypothetical protein